MLIIALTSIFSMLVQRVVTIFMTVKVTIHDRVVPPVRSRRINMITSHLSQSGASTHSLTQMHAHARVPSQEMLGNVIISITLGARPLP